MLRVSGRGFTLLELMLALALTAVLLVLMNMAIDLHLRSLASRRMQLEESQLARSILRVIADDVRAVVQSYKQDLSSVEAMMQQAAASAVSQAAAGLTEESGAGSSTGQTQGGASSQAPSGGPTDALQGAVQLSTAGRGDTPTAPSTPSTGGTTSTSQGSGSSGMTSSEMGTTSDASSSDLATTDLTTAAVPELPGIYGNQYQLQIDVSRLPRIDQYQGMATEDPLSSVMDIPSDVKTVTYYAKTAPVAGAAGVARPTSVTDLTDPDANASGLVRRELDRAVTSSAMEMGNFTALDSSGELIAPEVAGIEFRYFNGVEWLTEWDSTVEETLPIAIEILVSMVTTVDAPPSASTSDEAVTKNRVYSMIVQLPTGGQTADSGTSSSATTSSTTSSSSSGSATTSSGTTGAGL